MSDQKIEFTLRLTEEDWDKDVGAWRCPAFDIPSSFVKSVYSKRQLLSADMFRVEKGPARLTWLGSGHPEQIVVIVGIGEVLSPASEEAWWKRFALVTPIITALIAAIATYASRPAPSTERALQLGVLPNDLDGSGLPPAKITLNGREYSQPINYKVSSDVNVVVDVNRAYSMAKAANTSIASITAVANELGGFVAVATGNVCSGGAHGVPPTDAGGIARQGSAIQSKLNGIATTLSAAAQK
jgi:hypothetical protein